MQMYMSFVDKAQEVKEEEWMHWVSEQQTNKQKERKKKLFNSIIQWVRFVGGCQLNSNEWESREKEQKKWKRFEAGS